MFSLLQANWTYTGYDASAHVAEETVGARIASAWGIFLSVAVSAVFGYIFLFALATHLPDLSTLFPAELTRLVDLQPVLLRRGLRRYRHPEVQPRTWSGRCSAAGIAIAMSFCSLSSIASAGRMLFAFSRDDGVPGSRWLKKVSHRYRTPANALVAIVVVAWLFAVAAFYSALRQDGGGGIAIVIVTAISTIFLYAAYGDPDLPGRAHRGVEEGARLEPRPLVKPVAGSWPCSGSSSCSSCSPSRPRATSAGRSWSAAVIFLLVYYFGWARKRFQGPRSMGDDAQLTEIEREFEAGRRAGQPPDRAPTSSGPPGRRPAGPDRRPIDPRGEAEHHERDARQAPAARGARGDGPRRARSTRSSWPSPTCRAG